MEHLSGAWREIAQQVRAARHVLLLSDYDGTLAPIVERPEMAAMPERTKRLLRGLVHHAGFTVGIVSGRALSDLKARVGIDGLVYAGNHGLEIEGPGLWFVSPLAEECRPLLRLLHRVLSRALASVAGATVEDKGLTLSVHYRLVEDGRAGEVGSIFDRAVGVARSLGKIKTSEGKKVLEVRPPVAWDKGKAVDLLMKRFGHPGGKRQALPLFFGDDLTDEDAFRTVQRYGGISIFVGEETRESAASYRLASPGEVADLLGMLHELRRTDTP